MKSDKYPLGVPFGSRPPRAERYFLTGGPSPLLPKDPWGGGPLNSNI